MSLLRVALEPSTLVVAVDPGKVSNRVWVSDGSGLLADPVSLPVSRVGIGSLEEAIRGHSADHDQLVIAIEAAGSLHRAWPWVRAALVSDGANRRTRSGCRRSSSLPGKVQAGAPSIRVGRFTGCIPSGATRTR